MGFKNILGSLYLSLKLLSVCPMYTFLQSRHVICMRLNACICLGSRVTALAVSEECCWSLVLSSGRSF